MVDYQAAVIIPTRGGAAKLHYPLDALEKQSEKDFQVIVVIDGDIDGTEAVVESYKKRGKLNLETVVFAENRGRTRALNAGHRAASAAVLIRCDDDLAPGEDFVAGHLEHHRGEGEVGVIGIYHNIFPPTPYARAYGEYRNTRFKEDAYRADSDFSWHFWAGNVSMPATLYERLGGYDERFRLYGWEDVDMGYRIYRSGAKIVIDPRLETNHYLAATTTASRAVRALHSGAARALFVNKHGGGSLPDPRPAGLWGLAVRLVAAGAHEKTITPAGSAIDSIADRLPRGMAEKLVSLLVESSSYAGIRYPRRAQKVF